MPASQKERTKHPIEALFPTRLYRAELGRAGLNAALEATCLAIAREDGAGRRWSKEHGYRGYTSYASLDDLPQRASVFAELVGHLDAHARGFAKALEFDIAPKSLVLDSIWINVLKPGGFHTAHIHPHSVLSGTYYVRVPQGASAIRYEDPRLPMMMAAPPKRKNADRENQTFVSAEPKAGTILMWESWLRHEVPPNQARSERISISFNYALRR
jgi:uncharacterized protein (TIGR02466 family)